MSWLFGLNKNEIPLDAASQVPTGTGESNGNNEGGNETVNSVGHQSKGYAFDSTALERAALAAKDLEKSKYASQALDLSMQQEKTRQHDQLSKIKEYELSIEQTKIEQKRVEGQEKRKYLEEESKIAKSKSQYQDQLARQRYEDQLVQQQRMQEENLKKQEDSVAKQEAMRRSTLEQEMEMRAKADTKRIQAETTARAKVERENQDLYLEQIRLKAKENRSTVMEGIQTAGSVLGAGAQAFLSDYDKITAAAAGLTVLALGVYTAKRSTAVFASYIEARLGKPSLVRDTSRLSVFEFVRAPVKSVKSLYNRRNLQDALSGVILQPKLEQKLCDVALATKNTKLNRGLFRNLLFYGPPGTGKTLFAKRLAMHSGMDYAILTGGDIAPMGRDGVTAMHKVFDWASTSRKGLILFVDESDAFLRKRSSEHISEDLRSTLNAFLYRTGEQSDKFMLVLASNTPDQLDWAVNDRIDEMMEFPLPTLEERERLVRLYFERYVLTPALHSSTSRMAFLGQTGRRLSVDESIDYSDLCKRIAELCEGLSGREIAKLAVAWQAAGYASESGIVTEAMIESQVKNMLSSHSKKMQWLSKEEVRESSADS